MGPDSVIMRILKDLVIAHRNFSLKVRVLYVIILTLIFGKTLEKVAKPFQG